MSWYINVLKKYAVFEGRSHRTEYWYFVLFNLIISVVLAIIDNVAGTLVLGLIYSLAVLLPSIGVTVRRLHDTERTGWWILIGLIPLIGGIILLIFMVSKGTVGNNSYGAPQEYD